MFVVSSSFADEVRIDPSLIDNNVYVQQTEQSAIADAIYNGEIDEPAVIQVQAMAAGMGTCTRKTPRGVQCFCNIMVFRSRDHVAEGWHFDGRHSVRNGWNATYYKNTHQAYCQRD
jgi:hypothetical protein